MSELTAEQLDTLKALLGSTTTAMSPAARARMYDALPSLKRMAGEIFALRAALADAQSVMDDIELVVLDRNVDHAAARIGARECAKRGLTRLAEALGGERRGE